MKYLLTYSVATPGSRAQSCDYHSLTYNPICDPFHLCFLENQIQNIVVYIVHPLTPWPTTGLFPDNCSQQGPIYVLLRLRCEHIAVLTSDRRIKII